MNNQNFVYPVLDSNFPLGVLEEQNKSSVYEGSGVSSDVTFRTPSYPLSCENFVSDVNSTLGKELNGHMSSSHHQAVGNDSSVIVTTKPQPLGSAFNNMNLCKSDSLIYSTSNSEASVISAENQFCSSYPSPIPSGDPAVPFSNSIQPAQIEQFVSNTSDPNEFSLQFGPTNFTNHATVFANSPTSYNHRADNNVQPPLIQDMSEFNVELIDGNQIPKACPQVNATSESSVYCGQSVQLSASYTEIPLQSQGEFPDANLSAYPVYSDTSTTQEEKLDIEYNSTSSLSSECIAEASSHSCNTISQTSAEAIVNASSGEALNDSHNNNMQGEKIVASGICDANIQKNPKTSDENFRSSLSAEGNEDNSMNSENIFQPSNYQVSLDGLPNAFETFEDGTLSVGVQEKEMASGSNEQEKEAIDEAALHDESPKNQNSEDQIPCNTSCSDKRFNADVSANEQEALAEEGVKVNHLEGESSNDSPKVEENTEPALIEETISKPMSPMITVLNDVFEEEIKSEKRGKTSEEKPPETDSKNSVRVTRARTGTLPNKTRRFVDEYINDTGDDSSHDGFPNEDWEYEEGAELAPCTVDPSITVSKKVLQVTEAELDFYHRQFSGGVEGVLKLRPHCTSCGKHIGAAPNCIHLGNRHKVLRVLTCYKCQAFYGLGRFPKDSDGSEMYCRWCGQGGQIICCSNCPNVFCESCIKRNFGPSELNTITNSSDWSCYMCNYEELWRHRAVCWALLTYTMQKKKEALNSNDPKILSQLEEDRSRCCGTLKPKKRKHTNRPKHTSANAANAPQTPHLSEAVAYPGNAHYGHFLFDSSSAVETQDDDDDFIDPSQFVQPVLQEERAQPRQQSVLSMNQQRPVIQQKVSAQTETFHSIAPRPVGSRFSISNQQSRAITSISSAGPRIVIRQGNLMQPGLVPINSQPNSIRMPGRVIVRNAVTSVSPATPPRPTTRNPANVLNNMDGVRSMDQLLSLNQVPWFRDGIDNIRAVGFALTKRIRELEARFHSLKNKQDVEKVVKLGKKLDRLSRKTELRFKKINSDIEVASKKWFLQKVGCGGRDQAHPFNRYTDSLSDWDDDMELSRPLEKVMIPINTAAIQSTGGRALVNSSIPPPLVSTGSAPALRVIPQAPRSALSRRIPTTTTVPSHKNQQLQVRTVFTNNHLSVQQVRIPGPKSSVARYRQVPRINTPSLLRPSNVDGVNTFLNQRNGTHNISVSLISSTKRRRQESESSDSSDVVVCPTIPELLDKHNIRPCKVRVEKCDEFIVSFLENQEKVRLHNVFSASDRAITSCTDVSGDAECLQEVDTVLVPCDVCITDTSTSTFEPTDKPCNVSVEQDVLKVSRNEENILLNPKKNMKDSENLQEVESVFVPCDISINDSSSSFFEPTSMPCNLSVEDGVSESFRNEENIVITQEGLPIQNKVINVLDKKDQLNVSRNLQVSRNNLGNMTDSIDTGAHDDDDDDENDIEIINEVNQSSISYRSFSPKTI